MPYRGRGTENNQENQGGQEMKKIDAIVVHCSATKAGQDIGKKEITQMHLQRGFSTIGYNYIIRLDGTVEVGRRITLDLFMCLLLVCSCKTKYVPVESKDDSVVVEKLAEVQLPPDSATIRALLECDENGKVVLSWMDIANSKNA